MTFEQFFFMPYGARHGKAWTVLGKAWARSPELAQQEAQERLNDIVRVMQTLGLATEAALIAEGRLWAGPVEPGWPTPEIAKALRESDSLLEETPEVSAILDAAE